MLDPRRTSARCLVLVTLSALSAPSCVASTEESPCGDPSAISVDGTITRGASDVIVSSPHKIEGTLRSDVLIDRVMVGGVLAENKGAGNFASWSASLERQDLEGGRTPGEGVSEIEVVAWDYCGNPHEIGTVVLPVGDAPGVSVTGLELLPIELPGGECYLPADGQAAAIVKVAADARSAGSSVKLHASQGSFSGTAPTLDLTLARDGDRAAALAYFASTAPGTALLSVSAGGASAAPRSVLVSGPPQITPSAKTIPLGTSYLATVRTRGNLDYCVVEASQPDRSQAAIVEPALGIIDRVMSVKSDAVDCSAAEVLRVEVRFAPEALVGAEVVLRCVDTFGQEGTATFTAGET
ncbi:hypothetical protein [Sorangium sp. So ce176]|uniref:hypothetical protein n=1 Tax=Sorangium sp. So ce176 TaxID=3133286 RepID=UPI003F5DDB8A